MTGSSIVQAPDEFRLLEVSLTAERLPRAINLTNITIEIDIFESIHSPFLTGSLIILDDNQLYNSVKFQGTEKIKVVVSLGEMADPIEKNFVITRVANSYKTNDYTTVYHFDMVEDIGYLNNIQKISKMYDGTGESIIEKIVRDNIHKPIANIDGDYPHQTFRPSFQRLFRLLMPYITPFNATKLALDKITTENGLPYYLYSTLVDDNLVLADLETILERPAFNANNPFVYSQSQSNSAQSQGIQQQSYSIYNVNQPNIDETMLLGQLGAISSDYNVTNITTGQTQELRINIDDVITSLQSRGIIAETDTYPIDRDFIPDPSGTNSQGLLDYVSRSFNEVAGTSYEYSENVNGYTEDNQEYHLRIRKYIIEQLLLRNSQQITVPGFWFLTRDPKTSIGNQINITIFKNDPDAAETQEIIDAKRSGNFIIAAKRHVFNATEFRHICALDLVRLSSPEVL